MITVSATDLSRSFGDFTAVDGVSFEVEEGEIFGFLGSNGAGKTTTIRILCGLLPPTSGSATVAGLDVGEESLKIKTRIGYMSQRFSLYRDLTVAENIRFWSAAYGLTHRQATRALDEALEDPDLSEAASTLVSELPGGFGQRLALRCALVHRPPIVFLDEPTGGVDPEARRVFWDLIDELSADGITVFVTTHYMDEAERCHRVALMHRGKLLELDTVPQLKKTIPANSIIEIKCQNAARAQQELEAWEEVEEVNLFGESIHVALSEPEAIDTVRSRLKDRGYADLETRPIPASLEDVFIRSIHRAELSGAEFSGAA